MLALTRRAGEAIRIGPDIIVRVISHPGGGVRLAIEAPDGVAIYREEVFERIAIKNREAALAAVPAVAPSNPRPPSPGERPPCPR